MTKTILAGLGLALFAATPAVAADGPSLRLTTGVDYSRGDYGLDEDTKITVVPVTARLSTGPFAFTAALPYIRLDTPGGVVLGPDGNPLPGVPTTGGKTNGLGDLSLGAKYTLP